MRIYTCYTPSHRPMYLEHFLKSMPNEFAGEFIVKALEQRTASGDFGSSGFAKTCLEKVEFIIEAIAKERTPFLFTDVDVRFYGPVRDDLLMCLGVSDLAFQWDGPTGRECSGFMVIRPSQKMTEFWQCVRDQMVRNGCLDQGAVHKVLALERAKPNHPDALKTVILPERYWTFGRGDRHWEPGMPVNPPEDLLVHHANWTVGVANKMKFLNAVHETAINKWKAIAAAKAIVANAKPVDDVDELMNSLKIPEQPVDQDAHPVSRATVVRMLEDLRVRFAGPQHHPLPLALVIQFWEGDKRQAVELARLIADIEPRKRDDVAFVFARQSNCPMNEELHTAELYVGRKFPVVDMVVEVDEKKEYPGVCFDAWAMAAQKLSDAYHTGRLPYGNVFFFESDGCPIGLDWIDRLKRAHEETLLLGKRVTGPLIRFGGIDASHQVGGHINGTLIMHLSCWEDHPSLRRCPVDVAWDVHHGLVLRNEAGPSQIIRNEHGATGISDSLYHVIGKESAWLTSCKDGTPHHWCRRYLRKMTGVGITYDPHIN